MGFCKACVARRFYRRLPIQCPPHEPDWTCYRIENRLTFCNGRLKYKSVNMLSCAYCLQLNWQQFTTNAGRNQTPRSMTPARKASFKHPVNHRISCLDFPITSPVLTLKSIISHMLDVSSLRLCIFSWSTPGISHVKDPFPRQVIWVQHMPV